MEKLYNLKAYLKTDLIKKALLRAKKLGKLPNVSEQKINDFVEKFDKALSISKLKVGKDLTVQEVEYLIQKVGQNKHDGIMEKDLKEISEIILDKNFKIR